MRARAYIAFALVFCAAFFITNFNHYNSELRFGFSRLANYGWPKEWLELHTKDTTQWTNGQKIKGKFSVEGVRVHWMPCFVSLFTSAAIAAAFISPLVIYDFQRDKKHDA